jgi:hypothetical protein
MGDSEFIRRLFKLCRIHIAEGNKLGILHPACDIYRVLEAEPSQTY